MDLFNERTCEEAILYWVGYLFESHFIPSFICSQRTIVFFSYCMVIGIDQSLLVFLIERTLETVGYSGKPKVPHECAARVGNRGWSTITHRSLVVICHL